MVDTRHSLLSLKGFSNEHHCYFWEFRVGEVFLSQKIGQEIPTSSFRFGYSGMAADHAARAKGY
ncbi:hypothetical protein QWZ13_12225 [Reinekea marina]|uniref:hypothetical protein n=1 Tax=Reinekea marina TaxID=1310421 RepID=UPI0025B2884D|nr:hypothetical protein [Reinekea marina]MDN3649681.1 hypothetical protein [Reinekea marina]